MMPTTTALNKLELGQERTREWLNTHTAFLEDELESIVESSVVDSLDDYAYSEHTDYDESEQEKCDNDNDDDDDGEEIKTMALGTQMSSSKVSIITDALRDLMNSINSVQTVGNVNINNSTNVHIGNVTNIRNIQIITDNLNRQRSKRRNLSKSAKPNEPNDPCDAKQEPCEEECVSPEVFITSQKFKIPKEVCSIVPRHSWLAQMPMDQPQLLQTPVKYIVILHTATESSEKRAINVRIIRDTQCFHIESRGWNDIAYNFLIGCDGNIYEGRGWQTVGAHTLGYNKQAIGIAFIGCFMRELPTSSALNMCRNLLTRGVEEGHIDADYRLICHCQCSSTESPGRRLYEELQTWPHFYNIEQEE